MGKMIFYITMLIFIDLFFIATGQICNADVGCSLGSIIFSSLLNIENITSLSFFTDLIGDVTNLFSSTTGIAALLAGAGVIIGATIFPSEIRFFIPIAFSLSLLTPDFVFIAIFLIGSNALLGMFLMGPIILIYLFMVIEWLKGKD